MSKKIILASLFALVLLSGFLYYNNLLENKVITANAIKDTSEEELRELRKELNQIKADEIERQIREIALEEEEEAQVEIQEESSPYGLGYKTFEVERGLKDDGVAVLIYGLNSFEIRALKEEGRWQYEETLIKLNPKAKEDNYIELKNFLDKARIDALIMYKEEMTEATELRRSIGISIMINFAQGA